MVNNSSIANLSKQVSNIFTSTANPYSGSGFRKIEKQNRNFLQLWGKDLRELVAQLILAIKSHQKEEISGENLSIKLTLNFFNPGQLLSNLFSTVLDLKKEKNQIVFSSEKIVLESNKLELYLLVRPQKHNDNTFVLNPGSWDYFEHAEGNRIFTIQI